MKAKYVYDQEVKQNQLQVKLEMDRIRRKELHEYLIMQLEEEGCTLDIKLVEEFNDLATILPF